MNLTTAQTPGRCPRLAIAPIPVLVLALVALWVADVRVAWPLPVLFGLVHYGSLALGVAFIVLPAARSFLANGQPSVLMIGCGVLLMDLGVTAMPAGYARSSSAAFAIYNTSVWLAALCHFAGAAITARRPARLRRTAAWLTAAYAGGAAIVGLVIWLALTGRMPLFFVDGQGGTLLRSLMVGATVVLFVATAALLWQTNRRTASPFLYWYALGLVLLAAGLTGSMAIAVKDSPLQWTARFTQFLGGLYMCGAMLTAMRARGASSNPMAALEDAWRANELLTGFQRQTPRGWALRYGLAAAAVAVAFGFRWAATAWGGPGLPTYITFYPAVMVVALLAGFGPGLVATVLTGVVVGYWVLPPAGQLAIVSPVERLGLVIFTGMGLFMSVVAELYRRNRQKAAAYDRDAALRETRQEKEFLANLLENAAQPFAVGYPDGRIGRLNRAYEQLTGYTAAELRALGWAAVLTPPEWREREKQKLDELHRTGQPVRYEKEYVRKDGSRVPVELLVQLERDPEGRPDFYYSFIADITERRRAEQAARVSEQQLRQLNAELQAANTSFNQSRAAAVNLMEDAVAARQRAEQAGAALRQEVAERQQAEEQLRTTLESIGDGFFACDADWRLVYVNAPAERLLGIRREEVIGRSHWEVFPLTAGTNLEQEYRRAAAGEARDFENFYEPWGRWFHNRCFPRAGGGMSVYFQDITERKQAEAARQTTLQRFYDVLASMYAGVLLVTEAGQVELANQALCDQFGLPDAPADLAGLTSRDMLAKIQNGYRQPDEAVAHIQELLARGEPVKGEELTMQDGRTCLRDFIPLNVKGRSCGRLWIHLDITERQQAEEALRRSEYRWRELATALQESEERYRTLFNTLLEGFCIIDVLFDAEDHPVDYRFLEINPAFEAQTGLHDALGKRMRELAPEHEAYWFEMYGKVARTGEPARFVNEAKALDRWYDVSAYRVGGPGSRKVAILFNDITERQRAEQALLRQEADLREAQRMAHIGSWYWDAQTDVTTGSDELLRIYGFDPATQSMPNFQDQRGRCYPAAEWERVNAAVQRTRQTGVGYELDVQAIRDGAPIWLTTRSEVVRDAAGQLAGLRGTVQDITERKRAEEALRELNEELERRVAERTAEVREKSRFLEAFFATSLESLVFLDRNFNFIRVNDAYARACQRDPAEFVGHNHFEFFPNAENQAIFTEVVRTKQPFHIQARAFTFPDHPDWGMTYWDWSLVPTLDAQGEVDFLTFSLRDVTELENHRRRLEELVQQRTAEVIDERNRLAALMEALPVGVALLDERGGNIRGNAAFEQVWGGPPPPARDIRDYTAYQAWWPDTGQPLAPEDWASARAVGHGETVIGQLLQIQRFDGTRAYVLNSAAPIRNAAGQIAGSAVAILDVTAQRQAEDQIRRLAQFPEESPDPVLRVGADGARLYANASARHWLAALGGRTDAPLPDSVATVVADARRLDHAIQIEIADDSGRAYWIAAVRPPGEEYVNLYVRDITKRKQAEEQLRRLNRTLQARSRSSQTLLHATDEAAYLREVCAIVVEDCGHRMAWIGFAHDDAEKSIRPVAHAGHEDGYLETLQLTWADTDRGRGPGGTAIRTGQVCQCRNMLADPGFGPWRGEATRRGYASSIVLPLLDEGRAFGELTIYSGEIERFSDDEVKLLTELANDVAYGVRVLRLRAAHAQSEAALRESEEKLRLFADHAPAAIAMLDHQMRYVAASQRWLADFGLTGRDLRGRSHYEVFPDLPERWREIHRRCLAGAVERADEDRFDRADGTTQWIRWEIHPWFSAGGGIGGIVIFSEDITARKQAEQQLRLLSTALEAAANGIAITDRQGTLQWVNPAFSKLTGYRREEAIGQNPRVLKSGVHPAEFYRSMWETIRQGNPWHGELVNRHKDGRLYHEEMTITPVTDNRGEITHFVAIKQDVTERIRTETALRDSRARLAGIVESAMDAIISVGEDQRIIVFNAAAEQMFRCPAAEAIGTGLDRFIPPPSRRAHHQHLAQFAATGQTARRMGALGEFRARRADGQEFPIEASISHVDIEGQKLFTVILRDVTERLHAEEELQHSERRFHAAVDHFPGAFVIYDADRRLQFVNSHVLRTRGRTEEEMLGRRDEELLPAPVTARYLPALKRALATRSPQTIEWTTPPDFGERTLTVTYVPVVDVNGHVQHVLGITHDVTEERRAADAVRRLNAELEQRVEQRTLQLQVSVEALREEIAERKRLEKQVLDISEREQRRIGHDLHDSLSQQLAGIAYLSNALHGQLAKNSRPEAPQLARITTLLKEAIDQTRNLARGLRPVEREPDALMMALRHFAPTVAELFRVSCRFHCPKPVTVDDNATATHLYRIAQEAVHNAIKHGKAKQVRIGLRHSQGGEALVLRVADNGKGFRGKPDLTKGMGLNTMRYRAQAMGGFLTIKPGRRGGTVVTCAIPLSTPGVTTGKAGGN